MNTGTILDKILAHKKTEVDRARNSVTLSTLEAMCKSQAVPLNFSGALWGEKVRLIGEIKKASPSKGLLMPDFDPKVLATCYAQNGAAAISVLTETNHFQGSLEDLAEVKKETSFSGLPVLRKDFLYDIYQVYEARAYGADAILLIVAMLDLVNLKELISACHSLWMQALVEVHNETELEIALEAGAEIIGINNRNLRTFDVDIAVSQRLVPHVPPGKIIVSESGISSREDVILMKEMGVNAILVGEALMTAHDTVAKVVELSGV